MWNAGQSESRLWRSRMEAGYWKSAGDKRKQMNHNLFSKGLSETKCVAELTIWRSVAAECRPSADCCPAHTHAQKLLARTKQEQRA